jgi:prepilin-type N-terminal cleavage/methylation domain-containing protein
MKVKFNSNHILCARKRNKQKGFTQIELLIVILITGIIPALITPPLVNHYDSYQISESVASSRH